jgi:hypothetical protein
MKGDPDVLGQGGGREPKKNKNGKSGGPSRNDGKERFRTGHRLNKKNNKDKKTLIKIQVARGK